MGDNKKRSQNFAVFDELINQAKGLIASYFGVEDFQGLIENFPMPQNSVVDFNELPTMFKWTSFSLWNLFFLIMAIVLFKEGYVKDRTNSFISLDSTAGDCTEVAQTITGEFLSDANGKWNTNSQFKYSLAQYSVSLLGLTYTTDQWIRNMKEIESQVLAIVSKTDSRDFAWNIIAWSSYKATYLKGGRLEFSFSASASMIFDKSYPAVGMGNAYGVLNQGLGTTAPSCNLPMTVQYDTLTSTLTIDLSTSPDTQQEKCYDMSPPPCQNVQPQCESIGITLQALGYDTSHQQTITLTMDFNMISVTTALAINLGMNSLENLQQVQGDMDRYNLLRKMVQYGYIQQSIADATSSYYDAFYSPASITYCTNWSLVNSKYKNLASCFVRIGNTLMYPMIVSSGWYKSGIDAPQRCTKKDATNQNKNPSVDEASAVYYCNLMNFNIGFLYYPSPNMASNPTPMPTNYNPGSPTTAPTKNQKSKPPTAEPTYVPGWNTPSPKPPPTPLGPTPYPSRKPTSAPSYAPTKSTPTVGPTTNDDYYYYPFPVDDYSYNYGFYGNPAGFDDNNGGMDWTLPPSPPHPSTDDYYVKTDDTARGESDDDFVLNSVVEAIDMGTIFTIALNLATKLQIIPPSLLEKDAFCSTSAALKAPFNCSYGDIALSTSAFDALNSILFADGTDIYQQMGYICGSAYDDDWHDAGANNPGTGPYGPEGCSIIAVQLNGGQNRVINEFYFQPYSPTKFVAFTNTFYNKNSFQAMFTPPTVLIQLYYTCVMSKKDAFVNSLGLAQANSVVYTSLFFSFLMVVVVNYLNYIKKVRPKIRTLQQIAIDEAKEKADLDEQILRTVNEFKAMREDMLKGTFGFNYDVAAAAKRHEDTQSFERESMVITKEGGVVFGTGIEKNEGELSDIEMSNVFSVNNVADNPMHSNDD